MPGQAEQPVTYSLQGEGDTQLADNCIYIIEDSQLDLGLLVAVQRNLGRIFSILCDYLDWHLDAVELSLNPPPAPPPPPPPPPPEAPPEKPKGLLRRILGKIGGFFRRIGGFFKGLFRRKPKDGGQQPQPAPEDGSVPEGLPVPEPETGTGAQPPPEAGPETQADSPDGDAPADEPQPVDAPEPTDEPQTTDDSEPVDAPEPADEPQLTDEPQPVDDSEPADGAAQPAPDGTDSREDASRASDGASPPLLLSVSAGQDQADGGSQPPQAQPETPPEADDGDGQDVLRFEPEQVRSTGGGIPARRPYHLRYYLLYGGTQVPPMLDLAGTLDYLEALGFGSSELRQARAGRDTAARAGQGQPDGGRQCDFCGVELVGTEYEILSDGRERCMNCSRTAVRTEEEFRAIYQNVVDNLELFYGVKITAPVRVEMVNARKLHRRLGKSFVPTGKSDGRVLGVAIRSKKGYTILVENGAPRMQSTLTMAHELIHIWQYLNWDSKAILKQYGKAMELEVYEGMAKWGEIQYAYLMGETDLARREELRTSLRQDAYGRGFLRYLAKYPLSTQVQLPGKTPFSDKQRPL